MPKHKTITERCAERYVKSAPRGKRITVSLLYDEIEQAIKDGWSLKNIWQMLYDDKQITFSYPTLALYFKKIKTKTSQKAARNPAIACKEDLL